MVLTETLPANFQQLHARMDSGIHSYLQASMAGEISVRSAPVTLTELEASLKNPSLRKLVSDFVGLHHPHAGNLAHLTIYALGYELARGLQVPFFELENGPLVTSYNQYVAVEWLQPDQGLESSQLDLKLITASEKYRLSLNPVTNPSDLQSPASYLEIVGFTSEYPTLPLAV